MATSLVDQGSPKSGFLRLHQQAGNTDLGHGRMGTGYTAASRLVSDLVRKAYGENSEAALKFGEYLNKRGKVGVKSFLQLVKNSHTSRKQRQRRVLCWLYVCSACTKCHQQVCSGIDTAGYGFVCTAPLHRHANGFAVRWLWAATQVRMTFVLSCGAVVCFWMCVAGLTFSNDDEQRGT